MWQSALFPPLPSLPLFPLCQSLFPRPLNPELPQFLLQTLPMQTNLRCRLRNVPAMLFELAFQIHNLELPFRLAKIALVQKCVSFGIFLRYDPTRILSNLLRQIAGSTLIARAQNQAPLQGVTQLAHIARPIIPAQQIHPLAAPARARIVSR